MSRFRVSEAFQRVSGQEGCRGAPKSLRRFQRISMRSGVSGRPQGVSEVPGSLRSVLEGLRVFQETSGASMGISAGLRGFQGISGSLRGVQDGLLIPMALQRVPEDFREIPRKFQGDFRAPRGFQDVSGCFTRSQGISDRSHFFFSESFQYSSRDFSGIPPRFSPEVCLVIPHENPLRILRGISSKSFLKILLGYI